MALPYWLFHIGYSLCCPADGHYFCVATEARQCSSTLLELQVQWQQIRQI